MVFDMTYIRNILLYGSAILFVIFMNIQSYYLARLNNSLKKNYPKLHKKLIWIDFNIHALFIPKPIKFFKFIWFERSYNKAISPLIKKIRLFQVLGILFLFMPIVILILFSLVFSLK